MYNIDNLDSTLIKPLEILSNTYNFKLDNNGRTVKAIKIDENCLKIVADEKNISISYKDTPSFFRAMIIVDKNEKKGKKIFELATDVWFDFNGLMVDCSRNGVLNVSYAKKMIEQLAVIGQNVFMIYMEDTYKLDSEEYFGYLRGSYTTKELKEIDDYAHMFGIELIPCIQTLAHLNQFFIWEHIATKYVDIDDILNVSSDKVKDLLDRMIGYLSSTFRSRRIHIGMDEAYNLGRGTYADKNGLKAKTEIMREHLENMVDICEKYNVKPIIWDDMFFSGYSKTEKDGYKIPDGIDLMYWDYYNDKIEHYEENFNKRGKITNKPIMFAAGSWRWIGYASHHGKTLSATNASATACKNKGVRQVMTTAWGDDGAESPVTTIMFGSVLLGEHQYNKTINMEEFKENLLYITGMDYENFMKPQEFDIFPSIQNKSATVTPAKYTLYEDPLCSKFIKHTETIKDDLTTIYKDLSDYFYNKAKEDKDDALKATNEFYGAFGQVLSLKWNLGLNIYKAYKNKDKETLKNILDNQIVPLIPLVENLKYKRMREWYLTNKSFGFEVLDQRFGGIINRLYTAKVVLEAYIKGELDNIEELEEERLEVSLEREEGVGQLVHYNRAQRSMTANRMVW